MKQPKPILKSIGYTSFDEAVAKLQSATSFVLAVENGDTIYLKWHGSGWVINFQESYFCKDKTFKHKSEIPSFEMSHYPSSDYSSDLVKKLLTGWPHVYETIEEAIEVYRTRNFPNIQVTREFIGDVYQILVDNGLYEDQEGILPGEYRQAFCYNFLEDKFRDIEWKFNTHQCIKMRYSIETNRVYCDPNISTVVVHNMNTALERLDHKYVKS